MKNKENIIENLVKQIKDRIAIQTTLINSDAVEKVGNELVPFLKDLKVVQQYLDLPLDDPREVPLKKITTAAVITAVDKGLCPFPIDKNPDSIASLVDEGLTLLKVAYKTSKDQLDPSKAVDRLVKHAIARLVAGVKKFADRLVDRTMDVVVDMATGFAARYCPPLLMAKPFLKEFATYVGSRAKEMVHTGFKSLVNHAKPVLTNLVTTVASVGRTMRRSAGRAIRSVLSK